MNRAPHPGESEAPLDVASSKPSHEPATAFRSTWLASSLRALRERGLLDRYFAALPTRFADDIRTSIAGAWLPVDVAVAHYAACDSLRLPTFEQFAIGAEVMRFAQKTVFAFAFRVATEAGITPWSAFKAQSRMWQSVWRGGDVGVVSLGPKEARVEVVGWPCARFAYCRIAMRGLLTAQTQLFCRKAYVIDIAALCTESTLGYRVSWA